MGRLIALVSICISVYMMLYAYNDMATHVDMYANIYSANDQVIVLVKLFVSCFSVIILSLLLWRKRRY